MKPHRVLIGVLLLALIAVPATLAQESEDMKGEIEALKKGQQDIQKQLQELKRLIQSQAKAQPRRPSGPNVKGVTFDVANAMLKGDDGAKLTILEFTDYQ